MENPQRLWVSCSSAWPFLGWKRISQYLVWISGVLACFYCLSSLHISESLPLPSFLLPMQQLKTAIIFPPFTFSKLKKCNTLSISSCIMCLLILTVYKCRQPLTSWPLQGMNLLLSFIFVYHLPRFLCLTYVKYIILWHIFADPW